MSAVDLSLVISSRLCEDGREPMNVQLALQKSQVWTIVSLRHVEGVFLAAKPLDSDSNEKSEGRDDGCGDEANGRMGADAETLK